MFPGCSGFLFTDTYTLFCIACVAKVQPFKMTSYKQYDDSARPYYIANPSIRWKLKASRVYTYTENRLLQKEEDILL